MQVPFIPLSVPVNGPEFLQLLCLPERQGLASGDHGNERSHDPTRVFLRFHTFSQSQIELKSASLDLQRTLAKRIISKKMADRLPPELWSNIFDLAADEDVIFYPGLPTSMTQSTWSRAVFGEWKVRTPQDTANIIQRRSYATKKASIVSYRFHEPHSQLRSRPSSEPVNSGDSSGQNSSFAASSSTTQPNCVTSAASSTEIHHSVGGCAACTSHTSSADVAGVWTTSRSHYWLSYRRHPTSRYSSLTGRCRRRLALSLIPLHRVARISALRTGTSRPSSSPR